MEAITKFQPNRSIYLRGVDRRGAAGAITEATATGFTVNGVFRDMADFAVVVFHDSDNYYEHYRIKSLPDTNLSGVTLAFDLHYDGLQPIDSNRYNWIDWATLDVIKGTGEPAKVRLYDHATLVSGTHSKASGTFHLVNAAINTYDRVSLWYGNIAYDHIVSAGETAAAVVADIAAQINGYAYGMAPGLTATVSGLALTITAADGGEDGNRITLYSLSKNTNLYWAESSVKLSGGSSACAWKVSLNFSTLGLTDIRQAWLTLAPHLPDGTAYVDTEWMATFTNWTVTGSNAVLKCAGPGSVRIASTDAWCTYSGSSWATEYSAQPGGTGWFHGGSARRANVTGDSVTIQYSCGSVHDLYLGTHLYSDRGIVSVSLDGGTPTTLDCYLACEPPITTRRKIRSTVGAGSHSVTITVTSTKHTSLGAWDAASSNYYFYFDYLEAAIASDIPDAAENYANVSPALDYDTGHTYQLPPARVAWSLDKMGFHGPLDLYAGVFWKDERKRVGGAYSAWVIDFGGTWADGDTVFLSIGGSTLGKSVFPADTSATIAAHFRYYVNKEFVAMWAELTSATQLTIHTRTPIWGDTKSITKTSTAGTITESGNLNTGTEGDWVIDISATHSLNVATRAWFADFFAECNARGWQCITAFSMELVKPPDDPGTGNVYAARFADGSAVATDTGFGGLNSTHCAFVSKVADFQKKQYLEMAGLMNAAGLTPWLQFGEFLWWFFAHAGSMAFYDAETTAAASAHFGRALASFAAPTSDPSVNSYADAQWLRSRIKAHIDTIRAYVLATYSGAKFEWLHAYDVNYPSANAYNIGGRLNNYVNTPSEYMAKTGSGLDRIKVECLSFGAQERNNSKTQEAMVLPTLAPWSWPVADTAYLVSWFNGGCPWRREYLQALTSRVPLINMWAWDHAALMSWPHPLPMPANDAEIF